MQLLFKRFGKEEPPLRGIIHAAVEMTSRSIKDLDLESFQRMCRAKALGGWVLHQLTLQQELDFFVLFSSTTALWGVAGLAHYAAANQALDLLAQWRRAHGLRALSVNWGTWQEMRVAERSGQGAIHPVRSLPNAWSPGVGGNGAPHFGESNFGRRRIDRLERAARRLRSAQSTASVYRNAIKTSDRERRNDFQEIHRRGPGDLPSAAKRLARTPPRYFDRAPALSGQQHSGI